MKETKIELFNCDCMEYMKGVPDKFFDLAIVDPPYGIEKEISVGGGSHTKSAVRFHQLYSENNKRWDVIPSETYFKELFRISKNQIIWGGNYFNLGRTRGFVVWDKKQMMPNFSRCEFAWTSFDRPSQIYEYSYYGNINVNGNGRIHPTEKPYSLYKWLLLNYATCSKCENTGIIWEQIGEKWMGREPIDCEWCDVAEDGPPKIFDSHLGSGSIAIACHDMKFDLVGCEIDKDYYDAAVKRFENHKKQLTIF